MDEKFVCLSKDCIAASHRIFEWMDDQVDPCHDFNKFACGGFHKSTIIPDELPSWKSFGVLFEKLVNDGRKLLGEKITENDFESYKKAKGYYKSCMNEKKQIELGIQPLKKVLMKAGGWPVLEQSHWDGKDYDIWKQNIILKQMGLSSNHFATISVSPDVKNNSFNALTFGSANTGLSRVKFTML